MDEPRILTDDETYLRRAERASGIGPKTIDLCAWRDCPNAATNGPFCPTHRQHTVPGDVVVRDLTRHQLEDLKDQVEADAAPLFLVALNWIARQQLTRIGISLPELADGIDRIRNELPGGDAA